MTKAQALRASLRVLPYAWIAALVLGMAGVLVACGGSSVVPATQPGGLRALPADFGTRKSVTYSPFRGSTDYRTQVVTLDNIVQDLTLLAQGGFTQIRMFDSSLPYARLTLQAIKDNHINMKVQLGIKLYATYGTGAALASALAINDAEVAAGIQLANEFSDIVATVSVGNETIAAGLITLDQLAGYLNTVRAGVSQPLTTDDVWDAYAGLPGRSGAGMPANITNLIDFASVHTYPILYASPNYYNPWNWQQQAVPEAMRAAAMMDAAIAVAQANYQAVRTYLDGQGHVDLPISIGESGWKAVATSADFTYLAHPVNQKMYYDRLTAWGDKTKNPGGPAAIFYFEAFDEPWKAVADPKFNDDNWGLFNVQRQARYVVQSLYPSSQWEPGSYTLADALFAPTVVSPVISANRYTIYADAVTPGEVVAPAVQWYGFDTPPNAFAGEGNDATQAAEGTHFIEIGPAPSSYGWGALTTNNTRADLSQFLAAGKLNFSIRTTYPGKLMFGFGTALAGAVFVVASNTNADGYGYVNDGAWHQVSIPISSFAAAGDKFDLTALTNAFVIADIYATTGNTATGNTTKVYIDAVYWSK